MEVRQDLMNIVQRHFHLFQGCVLAIAIGMTAGPSNAQFQTNLYSPTEAERAALVESCDHLRKEVMALRSRSAATHKPDAYMLPDVEIYLDAVERNLAQNLFFSKQNFDQAKLCLQEGETRAEELKSGNAPWIRQTGVVVLGYRSAIDGSAQPYQVYIPADYNFDSPKPMRLDLFLHGRGGNLNEINFIRSTGWVRSNFATSAPPNLALAPYGRGNNGWRFCGEIDVFEALADMKRRYRVVDDQTTLRGFSMGGHGVFHIGLHTPGTWAVISPGAGFVDTKQYLSLTEAMPDWQEQLLHLYDAVDVAANAASVPMISYVGELDPKLPQYRLMADALRNENAPFEEIIAPKTEHRYEPLSLQKILADMAPYRRDPLGDVRFVTYTLRYPQCKWITIEGLERHWSRSEVNGGIKDGKASITTHGIASLRIAPPVSEAHSLRSIEIDGQSIPAPPQIEKAGVVLSKRSGRWRLGALPGLRKKPGLQGPIDDALYGPLIAVSGTGRPWNAAAGKWSELELKRQRECWGRYFRATLPETTDATLARADVKDKNLLLFGDPGSNSVLRRLLPKLPLTWTKSAITIKGKTFSASDHLPLLIFPNPESPGHYVVLNSGMTFSRADQEGSNALQYPHIPDYAVIRIADDHFSDDRKKDVELAGFFDESWR